MNKAVVSRTDPPPPLSPPFNMICIRTIRPPPVAAVSIKPHHQNVALTVQFSIMRCAKSSNRPAEQ